MITLKLFLLVVALLELRQIFYIKFQLYYGWVIFIVIILIPICTSLWVEF